MESRDSKWGGDDSNRPRWPGGAWRCSFRCTYNAAFASSPEGFHDNGRRATLPTLKLEAFRPPLGHLFPDSIQ